PPRRAVERGHLLGNLGGGQAPQRLDKAEYEPPGRTAQRRLLQSEKRREPTLDLALDERCEALPHPLSRLAFEKIAGGDLDPRRQDRIAGDEASDDGIAPHHAARRIERERLVRRPRQLARPRRNL